MSMNQLPHPATIMVVDDTPANLMLLEGMLRERGYRVRAFPLGRLALAAAANEPPDLILLDINMPEMTGYETCTRLKADARPCVHSGDFHQRLERNPRQGAGFPVRRGGLCDQTFPV
jgi:CheY-like chemotaxis protein